jgi:hypothetical protein
MVFRKARHDPLKIGADKPADATNGLPYSFALSATGGVAPYTWSALGGLPEGFEPELVRHLVWHPNVKAPGDFQVAVRVTDSKGTSTTANCDHCGCRDCCERSYDQLAGH